MPPTTTPLPSRNPRTRTIRSNAVIPAPSSLRTRTHQLPQSSTLTHNLNQAASEPASSDVTLDRNGFETTGRGKGGSTFSKYEHEIENEEVLKQHLTVPVQEILERLKVKIKELDDDEWMYESKKSLFP